MNALADQLITLAEAAARLPIPVNQSTPWRWVMKENHPLETIRIGGRWFTTKAALEKYIAMRSGITTKRVRELGVVT